MGYTPGSGVQNENAEHGPTQPTEENGDRSNVERQPSQSGSASQPSQAEITRFLYEVNPYLLWLERIGMGT